MFSAITFGRTASGEFYWGQAPATSTDGAKVEVPHEVDSIESTVRNHDIVVFSSPTCPFCAKAVAALKDHGFEPLVVNCNDTQRQEISAKCGSSSVPKVFVRGNFVGGCNDGGMGGVLPLLRSGKIRELMAAKK